MLQSPGCSHLTVTKAKHVYLVASTMKPKIEKLAQSMMAMSSILTPLKELKVAKHQIPAHGLTPNTSIQNKPLLLYRSAFKANTSASQIEEHLSKLGVVDPAWRYTVSLILHHIFEERGNGCSDLVSKDVLNIPLSQHFPRSPLHQ